MTLTNIFLVLSAYHTKMHIFERNLTDFGTFKKLFFMFCKYVSYYKNVLLYLFFFHNNQIYQNIDFFGFYS